MQFPYFIGLHRSLLLLWLLIVLHTLAIGCVIFLPWTWGLRSVVAIGVAVSLNFALRPSIITGLRLTHRDGLEGLLADGPCVVLSVQSDSTVFAGLIVLRLRIDDDKRVINLSLLPDSMTAEQHRVLRLWLRWQLEPNSHSEKVF